MINPRLYEFGSDFEIPVKVWGRVQNVDEILFGLDAAVKAVHDFTLIVKERSIHFRFVFKGGYDLVVFFNAAIGRQKRVSFPVFSGSSAVSLMTCNVLMIDDPALNEKNDVTLGWYAGTKHISLQDFLPEIIEKFKVSYGSACTILYGGSGGGFAALKYGEKVSGVTIVCANPQTDILVYDYGSVERYLNEAHKIEFDQDAERILNSRGVQTLAKSNAVRENNSVIYLQNVTDSHHLKKHFLKYFCLSENDLSKIPVNELVVFDDKISFFLSDMWGDGHKAPPKDFVFPVLDRIIKDGVASARECLRELNQESASVIRGVEILLSESDIVCYTNLYSSFFSFNPRYAYYLYRDGVRIRRVMYDAGNTIRFSNLESGVYRVVAFVKTDLKSDSVKSRKIKVH